MLESIQVQSNRDKIDRMGTYEGEVRIDMLT